MQAMQSLTVSSNKFARKRSKRFKNSPDRVKIEVESGDVRVRVATIEDLDQILELAQHYNNETGIFKMDVERVKTIVVPSLLKQGGIVGVIGKKGKLEAGLVLRVSSFWYAPDPFLEEMGLFVHPDFRSAKGGRASKLIDFAKKCAAELNMPLMIGVLSNDRTSAKVRLYERQFGAPVGAFFLWNATTGLDANNPD